MSKKSTKSKARAKPALQPSPGQLDAVERLLHNKEYRQAEARIRSLIERFPQHSGLYPLLIETLEKQDDYHAVGAVAWLWSQNRPNNPLALEALLKSAAKSGHIYLMLDTIERIRALGSEVSGKLEPDPELLLEIRTMPDGQIATEKEMVAFETGRLLLEARDFTNAIAVLEHVGMMSARNNLGATLFHVGRIEDAMQVFASAWQADADNLFALGWLIRLRCYLGDEDFAHGLVTPLAAATARRADDLLMQLDALLFMGEDAAAVTAFERASKHVWFRDKEGGPDTLARIQHFAACATARCGNLKQARQYWKEALAITNRLSIARTNLRALGGWNNASVYPAVFDLSQSFPLSWLEQLKPGSQEVALGELKDKLAKLTASPAYAERICRTGDVSMRGLALILLRSQATKGSSDAAARLKALIVLPIGTDEERMDSLRFLQLEKFIPGNAPADIWLKGQVQSVHLANAEIYREVEPPDLPPDLHALLEESMDKTRDMDIAGAQACLRQILEQKPDDRITLGNLGQLLIHQGEREAGEAMLRRVIALYPDYLYPRCNLAKLLIKEKRLDEAQELLRDLHMRERFHVDDYFMLIGTTATLSAARGNVDSALRMIEQLESMVETEEDDANLRDIKRATFAYLPGSSVGSMLRNVGKLFKRKK